MLERILANRWLLGVSIFVIGVVFSLLIRFVVVPIIRKLVKQTKYSVDRLILERIKNPLWVLIILFSIYWGARTAGLLVIPIIQNMFFVLALLVGAYFVYALITVFTHRHLKRTMKGSTPGLVDKIIFVLVFVIAFVMLLARFDVEITPLITTLGLGGLAVGLALKDTLENFFAGLHILSAKPIRIGDYIEIENDHVAGYVIDISWRETRVKTFRDEVMIVPNAYLSRSVLMNRSLPTKDISVGIECGVAYGSDLERVEKVTRDVALDVQKKSKYGLKDKDPAFRFMQFGDSNINFEVILRAQDHDLGRALKSEFIKSLSARYEKEKIEISWPMRKLHIDPEQLKKLSR